MSEVESDFVLKRRALEWIRSNPGDFIKLLPAKAVRFFWPLALGTSGYITVPTIVFWLVLIVSVIFYGLVLYGIWYLTSIKCYWDVIVLVTVPIVLLLLSLYSFGASRFALPAFPALAILASLGIKAGMSNIWEGID
jgi:hypothetical protein